MTAYLNEQLTNKNTFKSEIKKNSELTIYIIQSSIQNNYRKSASCRIFW